MRNSGDFPLDKISFTGVLSRRSAPVRAEFLFPLYTPLYLRFRLQMARLQSEDLFKSTRVDLLKI